MLNPDTATPDESIWNLVPREQFERNVTNLKLINQAPGAAQICNLEDRTQNIGDSRSYGIPLDLEQQLADDIAFVSAYQEGGKAVTAAVIEVLSEGLRIVVAANQGVRPRVQDALRELSKHLESCARQRLSRERCSKLVFEIVLRLNRNKIYWRLGSRKYSRPKSLRVAPRRPFIEDLRLMMRKNLVSIESDLPERKKLLAEIESIEKLFREMEILSKSDDLDAIRLLLLAIYQVTIDGISLASRLNLSGIHEQYVNGRQVQEITKLANYWRICCSLAETARSYHKWFGFLEIKVLEAFYPSMWQDQKRFVHAEVQLIVYYELNQAVVRPRIIGASKEACFLCDSFIRAHKKFSISRAHRQLHEQWTVPDLKEYNSDTRERLWMAIQQVNKNVVDELAKAQRTKLRRPYPMQSFINLHKPSIRDASRSTIRSMSASDGNRITSRLPSSPLAPKKVEDESPYDKLIEHRAESESNVARKTSPIGTTRIERENSSPMFHADSVGDLPKDRQIPLDISDPDRNSTPIPIANSTVQGESESTTPRTAPRKTDLRADLQSSKRESVQSQPDVLSRHQSKQVAYSLHESHRSHDKTRKHRAKRPQAKERMTEKSRKRRNNQTELQTVSGIEEPVKPRKSKSRKRERPLFGVLYFFKSSWQLFGRIMGINRAVKKGHPVDRNKDKMSQIVIVRETIIRRKMKR